MILVGLVGAVAFQQITKERPGIAIASLGNLHVGLDEEHEPYNSSPPTSGPHFDNLAPANMYSDQVPDGNQVHSLEDGYVMVQYDCEDPECIELVLELASVVERAIVNLKLVVLAPYTPILHPETGNPHRIALTAWRRIDVFDEFDEERITKFINAYEGIDNHPGR